MPSEIETVVNQIGKAFEDFKAENDKRLAEIEKGRSVSDLDEKLDKISNRISDLEEMRKTLEAQEEAKSRRDLAGVGAVNDEYKTEFMNYIRSGKPVNTLDTSTNSGADGGYAVPEEIAREIQVRLGESVAMRQLAHVVPTSTSDFKKLVDKRGAAVSWVGEGDTDPSATTTPSLAEISASMGKWEAYPAATIEAMQDPFFNVEEWLVDAISEAGAEAEDAAFIEGSGTNRPKGFLQYTLSTSGDSTRTFGQLQKIQTGAAGAFKTTSATVSPADDLLDAVYALKAGHRRNATFLMNRSTLATVRKWKDNDGAYIWHPGIALGQPSTLLGYPVVESDNMPDVADGEASIAVGNFKAGYMIVDRLDMQMIRNPYKTPQYVYIYFYKRVGGAVVDSDAIKVIVTEESGS